MVLASKALNGLLQVHVPMYSTTKHGTTYYMQAGLYLLGTKDTRGTELWTRGLPVWMLLAPACYCPFMCRYKRHWVPCRALLFGHRHTS